MVIIKGLILNNSTLKCYGCPVQTDFWLIWPMANSANVIRLYSQCQHLGHCWHWHHF